MWPLWIVVLVAPFLTGGCKSSGGDVPEPIPRESATAESGSASRAGGVHVVAAPVGGDVKPIVRAALADASREARKLLVYVGAAWCEPCQRFHHAAESGALDAIFPDVTLLEFDLDRDAERLQTAGYASKYIPMFALPTPDGAASGRQIEGAIKGEGGVAFLVPRVLALLAE
jgi:hypothetical protein